MAPEMLAKINTKATKALDIFALGIILYVMLFNKHPFKWKGVELTEAIISGKFSFPEEVDNKERKYITDEAMDLIRRMLVTDPKERITTTGVLTHPWFDLA